MIFWRDGWPTLPVYREDGTFAVPQDNPRISTLFGDAAYWNPVANYKEVTTKSKCQSSFGRCLCRISISKRIDF